MKSRFNSSVQNRGVTVVEIIVGAALFTAFLVAISQYYTRAFRISQATTQKIQSGFLLEEGVEAVRSMRDESWGTYIASLTTGTPYYLNWNGTKWVTTTSPIVVENLYYRTITVNEVLRDGNDDIISSGGTTDPGTRKLTVAVAWQNTNETGTTTLSVDAYLTNLLTN